MDGTVLQTNDTNEMRGSLPPIYDYISKIHRNEKNLFSVEGYRQSIDLGNKYNSRLANYNIETGELNYILNRESSEDKDGNDTGEILLEVGSMGNTVYYQTYKFSNDKNVGGIAKVFLFKVENMKKENNIENEYEVNSLRTSVMPNRNRDFSFLSGDEKVLITDDARNKNDSYQIGAMHIISGKNVESKVIEEIDFGNNIVDAFKIKEHYIIYTDKNFYLYDCKGKLLNKGQYKSEEEDYTIINSDEYFCTWRNDGEKFNISIYNFEK